jgi:hypothetical protein
MDIVRRVSLLATASLLGIAVLLGSISTRPTISEGAATQLARATSYYDSTIVLARNARPRGIRGDELTIALGYLERLRLGLGSPFRLVDEALSDSRLDSATGSRVAWALLARLRRGDAYVIDPEVLDGSGPWSADGRGATGAAHLALIDQTVRTASDPRAGELAVRLAYLIASAKGTIAPSSVSIATRVAALLRDRELASADLHDLLTDASEGRVDVMSLLNERRDARAFRVERPPLAPLSSSLRIEAMNAVPALVRALDTLDRAALPEASPVASFTVLSPRFARRLRELGDDRPPVAQIAVTLRTHTPSRMRADNDEELAAEYALSVSDADSIHRDGALALLSSAVSLRSLAQAAPWFPGDGGPDVADLRSEFGLADVTFSHAIRASWQPFYLRELRDGLRDVQRVLPALSFDALRVHFGADALPDSALAMHDPRTRTLQLSIASSGGTLAHELSHDLDWQEARRLFVHTGGYSTDRVMRDQRGPLALSMRGLTEARPLRASAGNGARPLTDRPAEVFARGTDWFIASALAAQGRTNGFLSAIEDGMLAGYAAGQPVAIGVSGATSLTATLDQMTYLPDSVRDPFESQWSDVNVVDPVLLVRRVLETPVSWRAVWQARSGVGSLLPPVQSSVCIDADSPETRARERLLMLAVDARARGVAARRARFRPASMRAEWANSVLGAAPWNPEEGEQLIDGLRAGLLDQLANALSNQGLVPAVPVIFASNAVSCSSIAR